VLEYRWFFKKPTSTRCRLPSIFYNY